VWPKRLWLDNTFDSTLDNTFDSIELSNLLSRHEVTKRVLSRGFVGAEVGCS
jgi:hypothetical protein